MKITFLAFICSLTLFSAGCCSIMNGTRQEIAVSSSPSGATVYHNNAYAGQTPAILELKRNSRHIIRVEKEGYQPGEAALTKNVSGWVWGNIFFGGLIGFAIDAIDGSIYKISPDSVQLSLSPVATE